MVGYTVGHKQIPREAASTGTNRKKNMALRIEIQQLNRTEGTGEV